MPRISEDVIAKLKKEIPLTELCRRYNIELQLQGNNLIGNCPFHEDKNPSFVITPSKNLWNCLGACQGGGDNIRFVMKIDSISFRHAVEKLQTMIGLKPESTTLQTRVGTQYPVLVDPKSLQSDQELLEHVVNFYHQTFLNEPQAMNYLQKRSCLHPDAIKRFKLGYANRTLGYRIPGTTVEGKQLKAQLQHLGVLRASGHEHLSGSVVIPIFDEQGKVVQLYGRKLLHNLRKGTPDHLYLNKPLKGVWNREGVLHQREWLLCESLIDALTLWSAGLRNVTCTYGINGWGEAHSKLLEEVSPQHLIICFDNDEAGNKAARALSEQLQNHIPTISRAKLPQGSDINDVARAYPKHPSAALAACIEQAEAMIGKKEIISLGAKKQDQQPCNEHSISLPEANAEQTESALISDEVHFTFGEREWRVRGFLKNLSYDTLKIQLRLYRQNKTGETTSGYHLDTLDLCNAKHGQSFIVQAVSETRLSSDILKKDLGQILLKLELKQEQLIKEALKPKEQLTPSLSEEAREEALALLRDPELLSRILQDYEKCGIIGEATNKLIGYLAAISRKLDEPLAIIIQSTSAAGKSSLMEAILAFIPEEERIKYSAMTGQSLYYLGDADLKHKVLAIVEEEGAERASYALKLLQSEGELTIASTGKDPHSGRMITQEYKVEGPVMIMLTTTAIDIDEELLNRCIVLSVDESREQTKAIHELQREKRTLEGVRRKLDKTAILELHRNAQRLLRPLRIVNPFAKKLTFLDDRTRTRRDHEKYLTLIDTIAFLHQYQRTIKQDGNVSYIEISLEDIIKANKLAGEALGHSLDELSPQTRRLLQIVSQHVLEKCEQLSLSRELFRFTRKDVRAWSGWGDTQLKIHLHRLEEMEYLLMTRAARGGNFVYELLYNGEGEDGKSFIMGLINPEQLNNYDGEWSGQNKERSASGRAEVGGMSVGGRGEEIAFEALFHQGSSSSEPTTLSKSHERP